MIFVKKADSANRYSLEQDMLSCRHRNGTSTQKKADIFHMEWLCGKRFFL